MTEPQIAAAIREFVGAGMLAGAATLVWQAGKVLQTDAVGWRDVERQLPMTRDTLFRIASMTKPITATVALMLCEEGHFALDDPITRWAPEFAQMRVLRTPAGDLSQTEPAARPITFEDLLTHRAGLTYADFQSGPIVQAYRDALGGAIDSDVPPDTWIANLARLPLIDQPGTAFHYGHSTDLLGFLIVRIEDAPLGDVLQQRIFDPLDMHDTGFTVPVEKAARCAAPHGFDDAGQLCVLQAGPGNSFLAERPAEMTYVSGGQGLWSTVDDYLTFARMFVNGGAVDGVRLLQPETLARMVTNQLSAEQRLGAGSLLNPGHGFGLGVGVVLDAKAAGPMPCGGSVGAVGWPGAFGGW
ncbi:MAG: serine hydrolase domain-containing protein [Caldilineaceae bacterium]